MSKNILKSLGMITLLVMLLTLVAGCASNAPEASVSPSQQAAQTAAAITRQTAQPTATAAQPTATAAQPTATAVQPTATPAAVALPTFTADELAKYDGQNGNPAYIAVDGKVYDVTDVPQWKNGTHAGSHKAGVDQTAALAQAPHSAALLGNVPIVGLYQ